MDGRSRLCAEFAKGMHIIKSCVITYMNRINARQSLNLPKAELTKMKKSLVGARRYVGGDGRILFQAPSVRRA
jgi:hypothetical protein